MSLLIPFSQKAKKLFQSKQENSAGSTKFIVLLSDRLGKECNGNEMKPGLVDAAEVREQLAKQEFGDRILSAACFTFILAGFCHS